MKFFDSHVHLHFDFVRGWQDDKEFIFNNIGVSLNELHICAQQAVAHDHVYLTAGIHPYVIGDLDLEDTMEELDEFIVKYKHKIIAIGETGLDFSRFERDEAILENQKRWIRAHYKLAKKHNLPLVMHVRKAHKEMVEMLESELDWYGVIHGYDATEDLTERYLKLKGNWMLSVSPVVFRYASVFRDQIAKIDMNKILVETDAPALGHHYMEVKQLITLIAEAKKMTFNECKKILWDNSCKFFRLNIES